MVYIVDDDLYVREGFEILLRSAGINSISFENIEAFLQHYQPGPGDMLMLDMHLPGMSGCELLEHLKTTGTFIPVIIITAYDEPASRECAQKYGALAFLRKPVDGDTLIDLLQYNARELNRNESL